MVLQNLMLGLTLGAIVAIYFPMIAKSAQILGSAPLANVPFFGIAFVSSVIIAFASGSRLADFGKFAQVPPFLLSAGVMSAGLIIGSSFLIPKIGVGAFVVFACGRSDSRRSCLRADRDIRDGAAAADARKGRRGSDGDRGRLFG